MRKPYIGLSNQGRNKPGCSATKDGWRLENSDLEIERLYYLSWENKGVDQLRSYRSAYLHICFCISKQQVFS